MSLIYIDSFDGYADSEVGNYWSTEDTFPPHINTVFPRTGLQCIRVPVSGAFRAKPMQNVIIGVAFLCTRIQARIFQFTKSEPTELVQCGLNTSADGRVQLVDAAGVIHVGSNAQLIQPGIYNYIEWKVSFNHAATCEARVNGQTVLSGTFDCQLTSTSGADKYFLMGVGGGDQTFYDDFYILNNDGTGITTFQGDSSVIYQTPSGDGAVDWLPIGNAQHFKNVREVPADFNATYNVSGTGGQKDTYVVTPTIATTDKVLAAQMTQLVADPDGDGLIARAYVIVNGVAVPAGDPFAYTVPASYLPPQVMLYETNPNGDVPWSPTQMNLTTWGIQVKP